MSPEEEFRRSADEAVLRATPSELRELQDVDAEARAAGSTFYEALASSRRARRLPNLV